MSAAPLHSQSGPRRLRVLWRDHSWTLALGRRDPGGFGLRRLGAAFANRGQAPALPPGCRAGTGEPPRSFRNRKPAQEPGLLAPPGWIAPIGNRPAGFAFRRPKCGFQPFRRAFTVLEMLIVITIIGFLAALTLLHLPGMTKANSMTVALQQLSSDCSLARQLAMSHRSPVYMVFAPPYSAWTGLPANEQGSCNNLLAHQYSAYALVSLRSVGDQPGQANPQYLTEWKPLPSGVFVAPFMFSAAGPNVTVYSTNSLSGAVNGFTLRPFQNNLLFPFPAVDALAASGTNYTMRLPYIGFTPLGQLTTTYQDQYIPLDRGRILYSDGAGPVAAAAIENPPGNAVNNCNLIHLDWLTARAKIERN